jgi:hypothetical protein
MGEPASGVDDVYPWDAPEVADAIHNILASLDIAEIDPQARRELQKILYRRDMFHGDGRGHVILLIRTIVESAGNGADALVEPIVRAVADCMRTEWTARGLAFIAAFDALPLLAILDTMRGLDLFSEKSIGHHLGTALQNKLTKILQPVEKPAKKAKPAPLPYSQARIPEIERRIEIGRQLTALRDSTPANKVFGHLVRQRFDLPQMEVTEAMRVARRYGNLPEIYRRLSWQGLIDLSSPSLLEASRRRFEARIMAGETVRGPEIARARLQTDRPRKQKGPDESAKLRLDFTTCQQANLTA